MTDTAKWQKKLADQIEEAHRYQGQLIDEIADLRRQAYEWAVIASDLLQVARDLHYALEIQVTVYTQDQFMCIHGREAQEQLKELLTRKLPTE